MREKARTFQDLAVWQKAHLIVLEIYELSKGFPKCERYGLTSQIRRSAISIPANIAEGFKKNSRMEKARFMNIAQGSLEETRYFLILIRDLDYGNTSHLMDEIDQIGKMLQAYTNAILTSVS